MPHGLEYIVRPFQSPGSLGNIVIPGTPERTDEKAHITWGGVGTMPRVKLINPDTLLNNVRKDELQEIDRDSSIQRIYGNDGESYIDVARPDEVRLHGKYLDTSSGLTKIYYAAGVQHDPRLDPYLKNFLNASDTVAVEGPVTWKFVNAA